MCFINNEALSIALLFGRKQRRCVQNCGSVDMLRRRVSRTRSARRREDRRRKLRRTASIADRIGRRHPGPKGRRTAARRIARGRPAPPSRGPSSARLRSRCSAPAAGSSRKRSPGSPPTPEGSPSCCAASTPSRLARLRQGSPATAGSGRKTRACATAHARDVNFHLTIRGGRIRPSRLPSRRSPRRPPRRGSHLCRWTPAKPLPSG
jgi:hypothetical protein